MSAIFAGVIFAFIALAGIFYYSADIHYKRWAFSHILFSVAFLPPTLTVDFVYAGEFVSVLLRVYGGILLLRAFSCSRLSRIKNSKLHPSVFLILLLTWVPVILLSLPAATGAIPTSIFMAFSFAYAARKILTNEKDGTRMRLAAGASFLFWAIASIPMILLPFLPELLLFGYLQYIAQSFVLITMFLSFVQNSRRRMELNLKLMGVMGSLISHDIRNYLNVAYGAIELAEGRDFRSRELIETARSTLESATEFINNGRDMLVELGSHSTVSVDLDLTHLVRDVVTRSQHEHSLDGTSISFEAQESFYVSTSPLVAQVIWNIIDNGIRHAPNTPQVLLELSKEREITLSIEDRAGGLDKGLKKMILSSKNGTNGLGLGLMLVREISSMCQVELQINDVLEDEKVVGSNFQLTFKPAGGIPPRK
ncbi:MAG: sensor histidine kinase [Candidatus Thorarchaeota archaeon]